MTHSYLPYAQQLESSERQHLLMLNHFAEKQSFERFAKTFAEHEKTKIAISKHLNRKHAPNNDYYNSKPKSI